MKLSHIVCLALLGCSQTEPKDPAAGEVVDQDPADVGHDDPGEIEDGDSGVAEEVEEEEDLPSDYIYDEDDVTASITLAQIEQGVSDGVVAMLSIDPDVMHDSYNAIIDQSMADAIAGDADCPYYYESYWTTYGYFYWYDSCEAKDDTEFSGYGYSYNYDPYWYATYYYYTDVSYLYGNMSVTTPEGYVFEGSGYSYHQEYTYNETYHSVYAYVYGNWAYDGPEADDTWLQQGLSVNTYVSGAAYSGVSEPTSQLSLTGSVAGLPGDINTVVMTDTFIYTAAYGSPCDKEPSGQISVRDAQGEWYDVQFQGPPYIGATVFPSDCDGCGQVYFRGAYLGDVCPDFTPMTNWEVRPW